MEVRSDMTKSKLIDVKCTEEEGPDVKSGGLPKSKTGWNRHLR